MTTADSALSQLCSATPDVFSQEIWARRAWLSQAADLPVQHVFSLEAVDDLLSRRGLRTPFLRMAKDGTVIPAKQFTGSGGTGATIADQVRDEDVLRLFADGATVVLQGLHRTWEPVGRLAAGLADELGHPVQVNAYVTPAQNQGFAPHYDTHDVFVLQISGNKHWTVHEPVVDLPTQPWDTIADQVAARAMEQPLINTVLAPGDCLYLPRGFIHSARSQEGTSVHLTFGIHVVTRADVAKAVVDEALKGPWQESLPVGWDPLADEAAIQDVITRLAAHVATVDSRTVATTLFDRQALTQRPEPLSPVAQAQAAAALRPDTIVRRRAWLPIRLTDGALILPAGRRVPYSESDRPALDVLLTGHPVRVQDVPCNPQVIASLLREGVLVTEKAQ